MSNMRRQLSAGGGMLTGEMSRHTTFRFCLDPTVEQQQVLARHAGAARFAFNQCLRMVNRTLAQRKTAPNVNVLWTGFDLINAFNAWKKTEEAGRTFSVDTAGSAQVEVTGLPWRAEVCQQVFEEAAVDCGRALAAWSDSRSGNRKGARVGFPRFKKKTTVAASFRLRNKHSKNRQPMIRIGDQDHPRSITLPGIGRIGVRDDTRRLRRMLAKGRAKILFATISHQAGRWWASLNVEASDLHPTYKHTPRDPSDGGGWVGLDRGCRRLWSPPTPTATKSLASKMPLGRWPREGNGNDGWRNRCRASKTGPATAVTPRSGWRVTTITSPTCGVIFSTRYPTRWSRPTIGSSSRTCTWRGCWPTTAWHARSPMPAVPNLPSCRRTNKRGVVANCRGGSVVPVKQAVRGLRCYPWRSDTGRSAVHLRLRTFRRSRHQCGDESGSLGPGP
jgi:hypothetical protein